MNLISTRDPRRVSFSYADALLAGLAGDGGLYVPVEYPTFSLDELSSLQSRAYADIAFAIKKKLIDGSIPDKQLQELIDAAYGKEIFEMERGEIIPVSHIGNGLHVANLSLGPTASFKDIAMQLLAREMAYELTRRKERLTILGATSGDTGSAAEAAFKGLENIMLFMLSPERGMSDFQRAQMGVLSGGNIWNVSIRGRFDDCQDLVKEVKRDPEFAHLGAVNSINWARICSQIPYYFSGYLQLVEHVGDEIDVAVPSGNFGNVLSGYVAKRMGLPIRRLIVATNENDVLHRLFSSGVYENTPAQVTSSPSMDISKASNYERLAFDIFDRDPEKTAAYMLEFNRTGRVFLKDFGVDKDVFAHLGFESGSSRHVDRLATIRRVHAASGVIIDPHTADGIFIASSLKRDAVPTLCMATALPVKFEQTIHEALGFIPERPKRFVALEEKVHAGVFEVIDADADALKVRMRAEMS